MSTSRIKGYLNILLIVLVVVMGTSAFFSLHFVVPPWTLFDRPATVSSGETISPQNVDTKLGMNIPHLAPRQGLAVKKTTSLASSGPPVAVGTGTPGCSLSLSVTPVGSSIASGGAVTYDLVLKNLGQETCQNTSYSFYYSDNEMYVSATPNPSASNYYWRAGTLAPGATYRTRLLTQHNPEVGGANIQNEVCVTADNANADTCVESTISVGERAVSTSVATNQPSVILPHSSAPVSVLIAPAPAAAAYVPVLGKEFGVWVWDSPLQMSSSKVDQVVTSAKQNGMNALYLTIDDYLTIAALPSGATKDTQTYAYFTALKHIITVANARGISVDVEGGASDWANASNRWKGYALIDFVKKYNEQYPTAKIRAFQYDVESYLLPTYEKNKTSVLTSFVMFIDESAARMRGVDAGFSVVIPHFYDSTQKWTPAISYNGKSGHTFTQLLNVLEQKPGSTLIIMSYRNFFDGSDGVQGLSTPELTESSNYGYSTKIMIAQETGNVSPAYVTFHGASKTDYFSEVNTIYSKFGDFKSFKGVATHYLDTFSELR